MSKVKSGNYVVVQSFMVTKLGLKGNELLIYAIIYGFSQNDQRFSGSLQYLQDWTGCSKPCVMNNLKSLCNRGYLEKFEVERAGVKFCEYRAKNFTTSKECLPGGKESLPGGGKDSLPGGGKESLPNNLDIDNLVIDKLEDNISSSTERNLLRSATQFQEIYNEECTNLPKCKVLPKKRIDAVGKFLTEYSLEQWREVCRLANSKDFLQGKNESGWKANIDFLLRTDKAAVILEGGYENNGGNNGGSGQGAGEFDPSKSRFAHIGINL